MEKEAIETIQNKLKRDLVESNLSIVYVHTSCNMFILKQGS